MSFLDTEMERAVEHLPRGRVTTTAVDVTYQGIFLVGYETEASIKPNNILILPSLTLGIVHIVMRMPNMHFCSGI